MPRIKEDLTHTIEIKKSRFITYLHRTDSEEEARDFIKFIKKKHPDATHHCTALVIGDLTRSNDDHEPAGTAGHPMLNVLLKQEMDQICAVVVRYFGGIKLGTGGLVKAYSDSVKEALAQATLTTVSLWKEYVLTFDYPWIGKIDAALHRMDCQIESKDYDQKVVYHVLSAQDLKTSLMELTQGHCTCEFVQEKAHETVLY